MSLISINIRGLGRDIKWKYFQNIVRKERPGVICIQETKLVNINSKRCYTLLGFNYFKWVHRSVEVDGGGILTMWYNQIFNCTRIVEGKGFIVIIGEYKIGEGEQAVKAGIINVYFSCLISEKMELWKDIENIKDTDNSLAWCVVGDFNAVRHHNERKGIGQDRINRAELDGFNTFIDKCQLFDIPVVGRKFTCVTTGVTTGTANKK